MAQKPSNLPLIVVAVAATGLLIGFNAMQLNSDPQIREKKAKEAEREAAKKQTEQARNSPQPTPPAESVPGANDVATWGAEKEFGQSGGKPVVTIAWEWTPALQGNSSSVYSAVEAVKKSLPTAAIRAVNLDAKPGGFQPGISVDGSLREPVAADGTFPQEGKIIASLKSATATK
ncbi:MAG: hypothetical protein H7145_04395 [Akkermansiaceae bacterium]|nr:hypothetical protein [Armatimonadota bacterium]